MQSLPGRIGSQDVSDCLAALDAAVVAGACVAAAAWVCLFEGPGPHTCRASKQEHTDTQASTRRRFQVTLLCARLLALASTLTQTHAGLADGSRAAVCGGSHGGFLTGHLLGQHPQRFK